MIRLNIRLPLLRKWRAKGWVGNGFWRMSIEFLSLGAFSCVTECYAVCYPNSSKNSQATQTHSKLSRGDNPARGGKGIKLSIVWANGRGEEEREAGYERERARKGKGLERSREEARILSGADFLCRSLAIFTILSIPVILSYMHTNFASQPRFYKPSTKEIQIVCPLCSRPLTKTYWIPKKIIGNWRVQPWAGKLEGSWPVNKTIKNSEHIHFAFPASLF
jgi:hypothetical protein